MNARYLLIFLLGTVLHGNAQVDSVRLNSCCLHHCFRDTRDLVTAPARWTGEDWLKAAVFTGATILVTTVDEPVRHFFQAHRTPFTNQLSRYGFEPMGNWYAVAAIGSFIGIGEISGRPRSRSTGYLAAESFLISGLLVRVPKLLAGRQRPDAWPPPTPYSFKGPFRGSSFPSGHTAAAFSVASVISWQYKDKKWVPMLAYSLAGLAGISRIHDNRHWASDVLAGAVVGTITGTFICKHHQRKKKTLLPVISEDTWGIRLLLTR